MSSCCGCTGTFLYNKPWQWDSCIARLPRNFDEKFLMWPSRSSVFRSRLNVVSGSLCWYPQHIVWLHCQFLLCGDDEPWRVHGNCCPPSSSRLGSKSETSSWIPTMSSLGSIPSSNFCFISESCRCLWRLSRFFLFVTKRVCFSIYFYKQ